MSHGQVVQAPASTAAIPLSRVATQQAAPGAAPPSNGGSPSDGSMNPRRTQSFRRPSQRLWLLGDVIYSTVFAAWEASELSMREMLQGSDEERDRLTLTWRKEKQSELKYVGLTSALIATLFGGAFSWFNAEDAEWYVLFLWYTGLLCALASIATATQQAVTLFRFGTLRESATIIRSLIKTRGNETKPRRIQVYVWQVPVMLLRFSIYLFIIGLLVLLWTTTQGDDVKGHNDRTVGSSLPRKPYNALTEDQVAIVATAVTAVMYLHHCLCTFTVYSRWDAEELERLQRGDTIHVSPKGWFQSWC